MKKMIFAALLTVAFGGASFSRDFVAEGKTFSPLGDYRIETSDTPLTINGNVFKTFVISYQNTPLELKVAVTREHGGKKYIVISDELNVQYVCNADYFGVERLDKAYAKEGYVTSDLNLDKNEYFHQKVLTSGQGCELDNTRLIASYFPMLIRNGAVSYAGR